ncbi:MAG: nicotinate (nicotinamide) nucleotide adenylyltransferase [Bacilli bacterium]|nr:nicotinate (nicotinamide) nucleotide adenylyltransferase [Bacilli bacterium]
MEKVILFGGTFDPVHNGHLRIARYASLKLNADVVFVPAKNPRWKKPHASITDRHNMLRIALKKEGTGSVYISDYEIKSKADTNYTIDTVKHFVNKFKDREICLLIGADQVESFHDWKDAEELARLAHIIYVERPGVIVKEENIKKYNMTPLSYEGSGTISSKAIRALTELDTPKEILDYIAEHELYYIKNIKERYSPERFKHALSVANVAYAIAKNNHRSDTNDCYIAGLLHDLGKKVNDIKQKEIMNKYYKEYLTMLPPTLYHQFVGAYLAKTELNINNESILDAIKFHATGKMNMTPISKIVYAADKVDPLRGYDSKKLIRACYKDYYSGFQLVLSENRKHLIKNGLSFDNPLTKSCMELYLGEK